MAKVNHDKLTVQIRKYLVSRRSPLAPYAGAIVRYGIQYGVNPFFLLGVAKAETSVATDLRAGRDITVGHNAFGMGPHIQYPSWEVGIEAAARNLRKNYLDQGRRDVVSIRDKWAPLSAANDPTGMNSAWVKNVRSVLQEFGAPEVVGPGRVPFRLRSWLPSRFPWLPRPRQAKAGGPQGSPSDRVGR